LGLARALTSILGPLIGVIVVVAIFGIWKPDSFLTFRTLDNFLLYNSYYAVAARGMTFVIITAGIDLSVGSTMALSSICCALAIRGGDFPARSAGTTIAIGLSVALLAVICIAARLIDAGRRPASAIQFASVAAIILGIIAALFWMELAGRAYAPMPAIVAAAFGIAVGAGVGFLNGTLITRLGLPPFVATLATLGAIRGLTLFLCNDTPVSRDPRTWKPAAIAAIDQLAKLQSSEILGMRPNDWIVVLVALIAIPLLHFTILGRYAYAIGSNERTARLCGVKVERYKTFCYVIAGITAGFAGVMMTAKSRGGQPTEFTGAELNIIAAVVIGGTSLFGGEGTIVGTILGVLMLGLLYSGCVIADISSNVQRIFIGGTIVLAAALDRFRHLRG
jgi:ribose/xylose/arabinose/galactoside ABC-type transport system permease subunit